jgi:hypothetical protein
LSIVARAKKGEMTGLAIIAENSLIKVLLFIAIAQAESTLATGIPPPWLRKRGNCTPISSLFIGLIRLVTLACATRLTVKGYF